MPGTSPSFSTLSTLNPLDWLLAVLLLYSVIRGALRGLVRELFALLGLVLGFLLACWYYGTLARSLHNLLSSVPIAQFVAFVLILVSVVLATSLLGTALHRTATLVGLGFLNRVAGAAFGLLRGAALAGALLLAVTAFFPVAPWVQTSYLAPYLLRAAHAVSFVMPSELAKRLAEATHRLKHTTPGWIKSTLPSHTTENPKPPRIAASETRT